MLFFKKLNERAKSPVRANTQDAGVDLFYTASSPGTSVLIQAGSRALLDTGISIALPHNTVGLIWDKSGIATKTGLKVMGGVIDEGYRGSVNVCLFNTSPEPVVIEDGQKIAQLLIQPIILSKIVETEELPMARDDRGENGFGSTGLV